MQGTNGLNNPNSVQLILTHVQFVRSDELVVVVVIRYGKQI